MRRTPSYVSRAPDEYDKVKCIRLFRPQFREVKTRFAVEIAVCVRYRNAECGRF